MFFASARNIHKYPHIQIFEYIFIIPYKMDLELEFPINDLTYPIVNLENLIKIEDTHSLPDPLDENSQLVELASKHYLKYERNFMVQMVAQDILSRYLSEKVSDIKSINASLSIARKLESQNEAINGPKIITSISYELDILSSLNWMCLRPNRVTMFGAICHVVCPGKNVFEYGITMFQNTFSKADLCRYSTMNVAVTVLALSCVKFRKRSWVPDVVNLNSWRGKTKSILGILTTNRKITLGLCEYVLSLPSRLGRKKKTKMLRYWNSGKIFV